MDLASIKRPLVVTFNRQWRGYNEGDEVALRTDVEIETVLQWIEAGICSTKASIDPALLPKGKLQAQKASMTAREQAAVEEDKQKQEKAVAAAKNAGKAAAAKQAKAAGDEETSDAAGEAAKPPEKPAKTPPQRKAKAK